MTPLDKSHDAMQQAPEDTAARLQFYENMATTELFLLLEEEPLGEVVKPQIFPVEGHDFVLVFDSVERLVDFTETAAPFAAMSGRKIAEMLADQGLGLGLNLGVAPSSFLMPAEGIEWLLVVLANRSEARSEKPKFVTPPRNSSKELLAGLDAKLASATGLAQAAYLVGVEYQSGARGDLLAFINAIPAAEEALQQAALDAVSFRAVEAFLDVGFFASSDAISIEFERVGLRFDIAKANPVELTEPTAPGMNPARPPNLK